MQPLRGFPGRFPGVPSLLAVLTVLVVACAPAAAPSPTAAPPKPAPTSAPAPPAATAAPAKPAATQAPAAKPAEKPAPKTITLPKPEVSTLRIGVAAMEPNGFTAEFARDLGLYQKYGFEKAETFYFDGAGKALQAIMAGQVEVLDTGLGSALSAVKAGSPLIVVVAYINKLTDALVSVGSVKSAADLKGKAVAVSQFGGDSHASVLLALKGLGLTDKDVTVTQIGGQSARIAALTAGSVAAAPIDVGIEDQMKAQGFNILIRLPDTPVASVKTGSMLPKDWIQKNPNAALAFVAANLEAMQLIYTQTDKAIDSFARWTQAKDKTQAEKSMKSFMALAQRDLRWTKEGFEFLRDVTVLADPAVKDVDVTQAGSYQFLDKLKEMGFNEVVGVPKS